MGEYMGSGSQQQQTDAIDSDSSREQREAHRQRHLVVRVSSRYQKITDRSLTIHI